MEHAEPLKHMHNMYPKMHKYTPWEKRETPILWQDITFEWTQSPRQRNAFNKTSILK